MRLSTRQQTILAVLSGQEEKSRLEGYDGNLLKSYQQALDRLEEQELVYQDNEGDYHISEEHKNLYSAPIY
ncbi:MAG: hypothetical protein ACRBFS_21750 [Aureispira sp.]